MDIQAVYNFLTSIFKKRPLSMKLFMYEIIYLGFFLQVNLVAHRIRKHFKMSVGSEYQTVFQKGYINLFHSAIYKVTVPLILAVRWLLGLLEVPLVYRASYSASLIHL